MKRSLAALSFVLATFALPARARADDATPTTPADAIAQAAAWYGLDPGYLARIARCESSLNPYAVSPGGRYIGLYQFSAPTWQWASAQAGYAGASRYDAEASAMAAAWLLRQPGGARHWPVCGRWW